MASPTTTKHEINNHLVVHSATQPMTPPGCPAPLPTEKSCPAVKQLGFLDSFQMPTMPHLPADLDTNVLKFCSLPTLAALTQVSHGSHRIVEEMIAKPADPDGAYYRLRRLHYQCKVTQQEKMFADHRQCFEIQTASLPWSERHFRPAQGALESIAESITAAQLHYLNPNLVSLPTAHWPALITAMTAATKWTSLVLNLTSLEPGRFIDQGAAALRAIRYGAGKQELKLVLGKLFSENDAHALIGYLRANPKCTSLEISSGSGSSETLKVIAAGLKFTGVTEIKFINTPASEQQGIFAQVLALPQLTYFAANECKLDGDRATSLANILAKNSGLKSLMLSKNDLTEKGAIVLAEAVASHPTLESLYLDSEIGTVGWTALGTAIAANPTLSSVEITNGKFLGRLPSENVLAFLAPVSTSKHLLLLDIDCFALDKEILPYFAQLVQNNPVLCWLGQCRIHDKDMAQGFIAALTNASSLLTVQCTAWEENKTLLEDASKANAMLRFSII